MLKSKSSAFFSLLLVFLSGALVGGVADRLYNAPGAVTKQRPDPEEARRRIVVEMKREVKLDDQQVQQYERILDNTREQWMQLARKQNAEGQALRDGQTAQVKAVLRPDQIPLYEALHAKHEAERKQKQQQHHKGPPPDEKK